MMTKRHRLGASSALATRQSRPANIASLAAFGFTAFVLAFARLKATFPILLADRLLPGTGWIEIALLALYAALLTGRMAVQRDTSRIRLRIWLFFSIVFFTQFILGITGVERLLMTGRLHVPVPAVVIAGPLYRGEHFFMPILFASTVVLAGPAWCSHLCYIGAWDGLAATAARKRAGARPAAWNWLRFALFAATPAVAVLLRLLQVGDFPAAVVADGFGVAGAATMAFMSARKGIMVHCTSICPLGLAGNLLGKISPFRLRIDESCSECGRCIPTCRYDALDPLRIRKRRPGYTCTLCGDCLPSCQSGALRYAFLNLSPTAARPAFLVLAISLHAVFLGVARI